MVKKTFAEEDILTSVVYAEILVKINRKKIYASDFIKFFDNKERSVLCRQLETLAKWGYVIKHDLKEKDLHYESNKKYYSLNFDKIMEVFFKSLMTTLKLKRIGEEARFRLSKKEIYDMKELEQIKNYIVYVSSNKRQFLHDAILKEYILNLLETFSDNYNLGRGRTIYQFFGSLIQMNFLDELCDYITEKKINDEFFKKLKDIIDLISVVDPFYTLVIDESIKKMNPILN